MPAKTVYRLDYTDAATGRTETQIVGQWEIARELAVRLARASGRRAIVTRIRATGGQPRLWTVHLVDADTGEIRLLWDRLTKAEVLARWRRWRERRTRCVLLAWPDGMRRRPWGTR